MSTRPDLRPRLGVRRPSVATRARRWWSRNALVVVAVLVLAYLLAPIAYTVAFSFNDYRKSNIVWRGFTTRYWADPCGAPGVCEALDTSLRVGVVSTVLATCIGTLMAFALVRSSFRGRGLANVLVFLPMATPEVVLGASLLTIFVQGFAWLGLELGFWTIVLAHVMFCLSFVVVTVKARLQSMDARLEEAAADLYAGPAEAFRHVTAPLVAPGVVAAALLSFALSFDDFIITNFVSGDTSTFPKYVYAASLRGIPANVNVIGALMFLLALVAVGGAQLLGRLRSR